MTAVRSVLATLGVVAGLYGTVLVFLRPFSDVVSIALWFAGGVVVHDLVLSPLLAGAGAGVRQVLPTRIVSPLVLGAMSTLALCAVAAPVLFRSGANGGNTSLLDRNYPLGFTVALLIVWAAVGLAVLVRLRRRGTPSQSAQAA